jgi:DNA-binding transcriptional regulator LsrR (DeoR family)
MMASYDEHEFRGITLKPGQVICGRKQLAEDLGISERAVRTALNHLKSTSELSVKTTNKFSLITIENWRKYQCGNDESDQQNDQQAVTQATSNRPHTRNKEVKNKEGGRPRSIKQELEDTYAMMEAWANDEN